MSAHTGRLGADIRRAPHDRGVTSCKPALRQARSVPTRSRRISADSPPPDSRRDPGTRSTVQPTAPPRGPLPRPLAHPDRDRAAAHPDAVAGTTGRLGGLPQVLGTLLALNAIVLAWRLLRSARRSSTPAGPADRTPRDHRHRRHRDPRRPPARGVWRYGTIMGDTFARIFQAASSQSGGDAPAARAQGR
jgi:hypothetical protein